MDDEIRNALEKDLVIDITTAGRRTGAPHRTEIWFHNLDGQVYITGTPGRRDWYANLVANPDFTFHLKGSVRADLPARAVPMVDTQQRREFFQRLKDVWPGRRQEVDVQLWVERSPLVRVDFAGG